MLEELQARIRDYGELGSPGPGLTGRVKFALKRLVRKLVARYVDQQSRVNQAMLEELLRLTKARGAVAPAPEYTMSRTPTGHFVTATRDRVIGEDLRHGHHFGQETLERSMELLRLHRPTWRPKVFIDVGANIGTHVIHAMKRLGFERARAFEISAENYTLLQCNLLLNGISPSDLAYPYGLSSEERIVQIEKSPHNGGDCRVAWNARGENRHREDCWPRETSRVLPFHKAVPPELLCPEGTLVWMDTQGHEPHILRGATVLFEKRIPFVIEFWAYGLRRSGTGFEEIWELLRDCRILDLDGKIPQVDRASLKGFYEKCLAEERDDFSVHTDLLVLP